MVSVPSDITQAKQAEAALRESESVLRSFFDSAGAQRGIVELGDDDILHISDNALTAAFFGETPASMQNKRASELGVPPEIVGLWIGHYRKSQQTNEPVSFEYLHNSSNGGRWLSATVSCLGLSPEERPRFAFVVTDVTKRKQAEDAIRELLSREKAARFEAEVVRDANFAVTRNLSLEKVLETLLEHLGKLVPFDSANVMLLEGDAKFVVRALRGYERFQNEAAARDVSFDLNTHTPLRRLYATQRSVVVADTGDVPAWQKVAGTEHVRSWLAVPLIASGKVIGLYSLDKAEPGFFTTEHVRLAESLAPQAASAIQNAQSFQRIQHYAAELEQRIAERERAELALRESESFRRTIIESEPECVKLVGQDYTLLDMNPAGLAMIGANAREQVIGQSVLELVAPEWRESFMAMHERVCQGESVVSEFEIIGLNGVRRWMETHAAPLRISNSRAIAHLAITRDITERRRAEAALQESEERFRQLSEASFEAIILHGQEKILEVNQSFCRMYGYEREEVIGKSVLDLALPEFREPLRQIVQLGVTGPYESPALRKDGTVFSAEVVGKPIHFRGGIARVAAIHDITEKKRNDRRQAAQYAVTGVLAESATLAEAMPRLLQVICESLRWKMGEFWRVCDSTNLLRCVETWHVPALDATSVVEGTREIEFAPGVGLPGRVWQSGQPAWIPDLMTDPGFVRSATVFTVGLRSAVAFPILLGNHTLGVMLFFSRRITEVDEDLLKMLSSVGSQIGQFTERKWVEEALRESEERYRELFEQASDMIYTTDSLGNWLDLNPAALQVLKYAKEELLGQSQFDLIRPDYRASFKEFYRQQYAEKVANTFYTFPVIAKDGTQIWLEQHSTLLLDNDRVSGFHFVARNITERKQVEEALRESEERYRELFENAKDAYYVHDLSGVYLSVNHAAENLAGSGREEIIGKKFSDFISTEQLGVVGEHFYRKLIEEGETTYETEVIASDGRRVPVEVSSHLLYENGVAVAVHGAARDITERKRTEDALRQSEREYRGLFENAHDAILIIHPEYEIILEVNQRACEMYGISRSEFIGMSLETISKDTERGRLRIKETLERGTSYNFETIQRRGDGTEMLLDINASVVQYKGQAAIQSINRDITDRKRAEEDISNLRRELELTMNSVEEGIHRVDLEGNIVLENPAAARLLGWEVAELLGKPAHQTMHHTRPDGTPYPREECPIYATFRDGLTRHVADEVFWRQDGTSFPVEYSTAPVWNDRNELVASVVTFRDTTERKQAEQALRESEERFSKAFHSSPAALSIALLEDGRLLEVNAAFLRMTGFDREEVIGRSTLELGLWDGQHRLMMANALRQHGAIQDMEIKFRRKSGEIRDALLSVELIQLGTGEPSVLGIVQDVTERNRAEEALQRYPRQLIEAQEAERQSIARELHDQIGQVLTAIHLNLQVVRRTSESIEARALIDEGVTIVDEALDQVRNLSFELRPSLLDDLGLVTALRWYADRFTQRTGIRATTSISLPDPPVRLRRELETACFRVVQEALTNVARHARATRVAIKLKNLNNEIRLSIKDDGTGFDVNSQNLAPFTAHVGLRGMRERTLALGGRLEVRSSPSRGTMICAHFPNDRQNDQAREIS